jgi:hypothetical protein
MKMIKRMSPFLIGGRGIGRKVITATLHKQDVGGGLAIWKPQLERTLDDNFLKRMGKAGYPLTGAI